MLDNVIFYLIVRTTKFFENNTKRLIENSLGDTRNEK